MRYFMHWKLNTLQHGFSLVEMSAVLSIIALLLGSGLYLLPKMENSNVKGQSSNAMQVVHQALLGFITHQFRLPCPDQNGDGLEQCNSTSVGALPWKTMGLSNMPVGTAKQGFRYGVYINPSANLTSANIPSLDNVFIPTLPVMNTAGVSVAPLTNINGLDFCRKLRNAATLSSTSFINISGNTNIAYGLADPGLIDADANGSVFDGVNTTAISFEPADRAWSSAYDDNTAGVSFYQLLGQMGCNDLGRVHALGTLSIVAMDTYNLWNFMVNVRINDRDAAQVGVTFAGIGMGFATFDIVMAAASTARAIACTANSFGACAVGLLIPAAQTAAAIAAVVQAGIGLSNAIASLNATKAALANTKTKRDESITKADQALLKVVSADGAGILM